MCMSSVSGREFGSRWLFYLHSITLHALCHVSHSRNYHLSGNLLLQNNQERSLRMGYVLGLL
ncbi:hypothetical protein MKX01_008676, partial [Papaver californicum]